MKRILTMFLAMAMFVAIVPVAQANHACPMCSAKMMDPDEKADHMATMLDLNDKQKAEVERLLEVKQQKVKPAMEQLEKTSKAACDEFDDGIKRILTDKQKKKYESMHDMKEKMMKK